MINIPIERLHMDAINNCRIEKFRWIEMSRFFLADQKEKTIRKLISIAMRFPIPPELTKSSKLSTGKISRARISRIPSLIIEKTINKTATNPL